MSVQLPTIEFRQGEISRTVNLNDCHVYTNWLAKKISWLLGRSVDIQVGDQVLTVSINDIAQKLYSGANRARPRLFWGVGEKRAIANELKELSSSCYSPLTKDVMQVYAIKLCGWLGGSMDKAKGYTTEEVM